MSRKQFIESYACILSRKMITRNLLCTDYVLRTVLDATTLGEKNNQTKDNVLHFLTFLL